MNQDNDIATLYVPWSDLKELQVITILQTLQQNVKGEKSYQIWHGLKCWTQNQRC